MDGLIDLNARRVQRNQDYGSLLRITVFFFLLSAMVLVQREAGNTFMAAAPVVRSMFGDLDSEGFTISGPSEIYDFVDNFAGSVLEDSKCGDGVCDQNQYEYPGFGRFGCQDDCGKYSKTSLITVQLDDFLGASKNYNTQTIGGATWDLSKVSRSYSPAYKWNIYSHTMGAYIFEEHQNVTGHKAVVEIPDGKHELRLFQVSCPPSSPLRFKSRRDVCVCGCVYVCAIWCVPAVCVCLPTVCVCVCVWCWGSWGRDEGAHLHRPLTAFPQSPALALFSNFSPDSSTFSRFGLRA